MVSTNYGLGKNPENKIRSMNIKGVSNSENFLNRFETEFNKLLTDLKKDKLLPFQDKKVSVERRIEQFNRWVEKEHIIRPNKKIHERIEMAINQLEYCLKKDLDLRVGTSNKTDWTHGDRFISRIFQMNIWSPNIDTEEVKKAKEMASSGEVVTSQAYNLDRTTPSTKNEMLIEGLTKDVKALQTELNRTPINKLAVLTIASQINKTMYQMKWSATDTSMALRTTVSQMAKSMSNNEELAKKLGKDNFENIESYLANLKLRPNF